MLDRFRARRERRRREQQAIDRELREEQAAAEQRLGIDPAELDGELRQAEAAPWRRGLGWWMSPRQRRESADPPPDEK